MFKLKNKEFTFDVDVSHLPCGLNGALYFVQMDADGGLSKYETNTAGAEYGTGYCDAQCPHDLKYINGETNTLEWTPSATDPNSGIGKYGTCCVEMDIWEANAVSTAFTPHACSVTEQTRCEGVDCGDNPDHRFDGVCDKNGCDFQTYRLGNASFYGSGPSFAIDTSKPVTVTTRFVTEDHTDTGKLVEIQRSYTQSGRVVKTPSIMVGGKGPFDSVSTDYCQAEVALFADGTNFLGKGGMGAMDAAFEQGMVLVMSLWDDHSANMLWLDATYPTDGTASGSKRGTCAASSGDPKQVESQSADAYVKYMNIKFGDIGSTTTAGLSPPSPTVPPVRVAAAGPGYRCHARKGQCVPSPLSKTSRAGCEKSCKKSAYAVEVAGEEPTAKTCPTAAWMQCDGASFGGASCCPMGFECLARTDAFHQCVPSAALTEAFVHTRPSKEMVEDFLRDGTTLFSAAGLATYPATDAAAPRVVAA